MRTLFPSGVLLLCGVLGLLPNLTHAAVIYVNTNNLGPRFAGTSWATAFPSIQQGLDTAATGDEVWVSQGVYIERVTLKKGVGLYGGFLGTETARSQQDIAAHLTALDGNQRGSVVTVPEGATAATVLSGFTILNGTGTAINNGAPIGGGIYSLNASPTIANNRITDNSAFPGRGGGIFCDGGSPTITNNTITRNTASEGAALVCQNASLTLAGNFISGNRTTPPGIVGTGGALVAYFGTIMCFNTTGTITDNTVSNNVFEWYAGIPNVAGFGGGLGCKQCTLTIVRNAFIGNQLRVIREEAALAMGGGLYGEDSSLAVRDNLFVGNTAYAQSFNNRAYGAGLAVNGGSLTLVNNTIADNALSLYFSIAEGMKGGGVYLSAPSGAGAVFSAINNVVAFNSSGLWTDTTPEWSHNDVYGNALFDYQGVADPTGTDGNLRADPLFVDRGAEDYRVQPSSPCIDAGDDGSAQGGTDLAGKPRVMGAHVDIGAYEFAQGAGFSLVDVTRALKAAAGLATLSADDLARWNVETDGVSKSTVDLADAVRLARKAAGLDPNP